MYPSAPFPEHPHSSLYDRTPGIPFGEEKDEPLPFTGQALRLCFNCGSPDHAVVTCPDPIDRELVSLSRQLFNFLHPDLTGQETTRFYLAEGWKQRRLEWLTSYEPGVIRGPLLRDALGLQERDSGSTAEWLRNMAYWGYPPGDDAEDPVTTLECKSFMIFEGTDDDEEIDLALFCFRGPSAPSPAPSPSTVSVDDTPTRWAVYPNTYFSSTALSIYNGMPLGSVASSHSRVSATFTPERRALWERILSGGSGSGSTPSIPPWRLPGVFGAPVVESAVPPPPPTTPPPLPLTQTATLCTFTPPKRSMSCRGSMPASVLVGPVDVTDDESIVDMDTSDDSE